MKCDYLSRDCLFRNFSKKICTPRMLKALLFIQFYCLLKRLTLSLLKRHFLYLSLPFCLNYSPSVSAAAFSSEAKLVVCKSLITAFENHRVHKQQGKCKKSFPVFICKKRGKRFKFISVRMFLQMYL